MTTKAEQQWPNEDETVEAMARAMWKERQAFAALDSGIALEDYDTPWGSVSIGEANNVPGEARAAYNAFRQMAAKS